MWTGNDWDNVHLDVYNYANCGIHKHADLEEMCRGVWEQSGRDMFEKWVRLKVMEPFLFMKSYAFGNCTLWGKAAGLLPKENLISDGRVDQNTKEIILLVDTVAYHLSWILQFLQVLSQSCPQIRSLLIYHKRNAGELLKCCLLDDAAKCIAQNDLYKIFRKYIPLDGHKEKMLVAAFCITFVSWQQLFDKTWQHETPELGTKLNNEQTKHKMLGNEEFKDNMFNQAVATYTKIIKEVPDNSIIYGNRANAYLKLGKFNEAEIDGRRLVILDPSNSKGYFRMATAKEGLEEYHSGHQLAAHASRLCADAGQAWSLLFDLSVRLQKLCEAKGLCQKDRRIQHQVTVSREKDTSGLPDLVSSEEDSSDENEELNNGYSVHSVLPPVYSEENNNNTVNSPGKQSVSPPKMFQYNLVELLKTLKALQQQGSQSLHLGNPQEAVQKYLEALEILPKLAEQNYEPDVEEKVCLKYALGIAYQRGTPEMLLQSLETFQEILNNYSDLNFIPAHSGIGETYVKLFRFDQALEHLTIAQKSVEERKQFRTYNWPGTKDVIEDSIREDLSDKMNELIQLCQYPSVPDAVCRSDYCLLPSKNIYFGDPEFKGYYRLTCEGNCKLEYHSQCWKKVKEPLDGNKKGVVGQVCLTPDCGHIVVGLEKLDHDGSLLSKTGTACEKDVKPKKSKSEKKTGNKDKKSKRKERHRQASICEPEEQASSGTVEQSVLEPDNKELVKPALPSYDVNDEPAYVLRKGESPQGDGSLNEKSLSSSNLNVTNVVQNKKKRQKTKKQITLTAQEFCGDILENEETHFSRYLRRVHELQRAKSLVEGADEDWPALTSNFTLNPDSPFFVPEHLRDNPEALERVLQKHLLSSQQVQYLQQPSEPELTDESDRTEEIMATVFEYIENFLRVNGPMHKDSLFLREELSCFPESTQALINRSGGLTNFLKQSERFVIEGNIISVIPQNNNLMSVPEIKRSEVVETKRKPENAKELNVKKKSESNHQKEALPNVERSDSCESNKSNSTSSSALKSIQKLTKSFSNDLQVAMFKLQVSISALDTEDQQQIVCSVINSVKSNLNNDFWTDINPQLESVQVSIKGVESQDQNKISIAEFDRLSEANKNLEERLSSALDTITQLQNTQSFKNSKFEEEISELKTTNKKLQVTLNSQQDRIDSERQQLQQERAKVKDEAQNLKKEKDQEVETARHLLAKVMTENDKLKAKLEKERDDNTCLKKTITSLMENYEEASVQAQSAKEELVKLKKREGLKLLDKELESVVKTKAQLLDTKKREQEKPTMSSSHFQVFVEKPLQDCDLYVNTLTDLKNSFLVLVNENLEALQQGKDPPGTELDIPKVPTLPESLQTIRQATNSLLPTPNYQPSILGNPIFQLPNSAISSLSASVGRSMSPDVSSPLHSVSGMAMPNLFPNTIFRTTPTPTSVSSQMFKSDNPNVNSLTTGLANSGHTGMHSQGHSYLASSGNLMPLFNFPNVRSSQLFSTASSQIPLHNFQSLGTDTAVHCTPLLSKNSPSVPLLTQTVSSSAIGQVPVKSVSSVPSKPTPSIGPSFNIPNQSIPQTKPASLDPKPIGASFNNLSHVTLPSTLLSTKGARSGPISAPPGMENLPISFNMPGDSIFKPPSQSKLVVGKVEVPVASSGDTPRPPSASSSVSAPAPKTSHDKLIRRLQEIHPKMSSAQLQNYIQLLRSQCKSLSGMSIDKLVEEVTALIHKNPRLEIPKARVITPVIERSGQVPKKLYSSLDLIEQNTTVIKGNQKEPWGGAASSMPAWSGSDDNTCSICLETMTASPDIHQTDCKHRFHFPCIQKWLKRNSKCPICNSHTLLPTEFPPLGS